MHAFGLLNAGGARGS